MKHEREFEHRYMGVIPFVLMGLMYFGSHVYMWVVG